MKMNIQLALKKEWEGSSLTTLVEQPVTILQGIGPVHAQQLADLNISTLRHLANYRYFHVARALVTLSQVEDTTASSSTTGFNLNKALDKAYETQSLHDICQAPPSALQGLTTKSDVALAGLGIHTIADLADWKFAHWAEALQVAQAYEQQEAPPTTTEPKD